MKKSLCSVVLLASLFCGAATSKPNPSGDLKIEVVRASRSGKITVQIENSSKEPIRLWRGWNSWGWGIWRVLRLRKGRLETFFQKPDKTFNRNGPVSYEIAAGACATEILNINRVEWYGFRSKRVTLRPGDMITVVYDVPATDPAIAQAVWNGVAATFMTVR